MVDALRARLLVAKSREFACQTECAAARYHRESYAALQHSLFQPKSAHRSVLCCFGRRRAILIMNCEQEMDARLKLSASPLCGFVIIMMAVENYTEKVHAFEHDFLYSGPPPARTYQKDASVLRIIWDARFPFLRNAFSAVISETSKTPKPCQCLLQKATHTISHNAIFVSSRI